MDCSAEPALLHRFRLRAGLRRVTSSERMRSCGVRCVQRDGECCALDVTMSKERTMRWRGVLLCGRIWCCPVCSEKLRAERATEVQDALEGAGGRWQMVTFTVRHHQGQKLEHVLNVLRAAWRRCKQGGAIQRIMKGRVSASVRAVEVTYGENGWHPHVHVLWRTTQWSDDERDKLFERWMQCISRLDESMLPDARHAVVWSAPIDASHSDDRKRARYVAKLGLEIVGVAKWERSVWSLAARAVRGDAQSAALWREFEGATRGARMIECDERATIFAARARTTRELACESRDVEPSEVVTISIDRTELQLLRAAERRDERFLARLMVALSVSDDVRRTFAEHLSRATVLVRSSLGGADGTKDENEDGGKNRRREELPAAPA